MPLNFYSSKRRPAIFNTVERNASMLRNVVIANLCESKTAGIILQGERQRVKAVCMFQVVFRAKRKWPHGVQSVRT
jgi:hypothetical protein